MRLLEPYSKFGSRQCGFGVRSGCAEALWRFGSDVFEAGNTCEGAMKVAAILLDTRRAFDSVPIWAALRAYRLHRCPAWLLRCLQNWMSGRSFRVRVDSRLSESLPADSGVPQGSISGPCLFNVTYDVLCDLDLPEGVKLCLYIRRRHRGCGTHVHKRAP